MFHYIPRLTIEAHGLRKRIANIHHRRVDAAHVLSQCAPKTRAPKSYTPRCVAAAPPLRQRCYFISRFNNSAAQRIITYISTTFYLGVFVLEAYFNLRHASNRFKRFCNMRNAMTAHHSFNSNCFLHSRVPFVIV